MSPKALFGAFLMVTVPVYINGAVVIYSIPHARASYATALLVGAALSVVLAFWIGFSEGFRK